MADFGTINFTRDGSIAAITLNRPDAANAMNLQLVRELAQAALICDNDKSLKVVLVTGAGKMFSAGGDLKAFAGYGDETSLKLKELADELHRAISLFARMAPVVVIAVNGMAAGAGFSLSLIGDIVIAAESAKFTMAYTRAGLSPDGSSTYYMPRLIGLRRTQELMLTNRMLTAREALDWGLVTHVVADDKLQDESRAVVAHLAAGPRHAQSVVKKLLLSTLRHGLEEQMEIEGREIAAAAVSADGQEGIKAFVGKHKPKFV